MEAINHNMNHQDGKKPSSTICKPSAFLFALTLTVIFILFNY